MDTNHSSSFTSDRRGWHLDKGIPISTLLTIGTFMVSMIIWALNVEKRVELNTFILDTAIATQKEYIQQSKIQHKEDQEIIRDIRDKLARLDR